MRKVAIGIDIGGTSIKSALVGESGRILAQDAFPTRDHPGRAKLLGAMQEKIAAWTALASRRGWKVAGIGIGAPGPVDVGRGFVYFFPNIPGWKNTPLREVLRRRFRMPVFVDNDANVMALAECYAGAGRRAKNMIALTLGTGVGGGILIDGKLFHGPAYSAAEVGHVVLDVKGPRCGCGNRGCIETFAGNRYFVREVALRLKKHPSSLLNRLLKQGGRELTPRLVHEAALRGDRFALSMWERMGERLGLFLVGLVNVLNPEIVVIGGGVAQAGRFLFDPLRRMIEKKAFPIAARSVRVVKAKLGPEAGVIGAGMLVFTDRN